MKRIGLLSDTHGSIHPRVFSFFGDCDELWHAGDIGNYDTYVRLKNFKPIRAVFGNIDGRDLRSSLNETEIFKVENIVVIMTHIGGYPGNYERSVVPLIIENKPNIFVSGHSHILKVKYDNKFELLHINPGAAGNQGFHKHLTMVKFEIDDINIRNMEVFEVKRG